jgi:prepilin-type N-terminal cleavage/methylation domain-containing protein
MSASTTTGQFAAEDGFTLSEVVIAMAISLILLLATLATFDVFTSNTVKNNNLTAAQDAARGELDAMVGNLRNASSSTGSTVVLRAGASDLVVNTDRPGYGFTATTPAQGTARYCLDSAANGKLWFNWTATPNTLPSATCPASGWSQRVLLTNTRNQANNQALFSYDTPTLTALRGARMNLLTAIGTDATKSTRLQSAVSIRSLQNTTTSIDPTPVTATCTGGVLTVGLGASNTDANGNPLQFVVTETLSDGSELQLASGIGTKVLTTTSGAHNLNIKVTNVLNNGAQLITRSVTC